MPADRASRISIRVLLAIAFVTHLPLLFNDGIYWDSWMPELASERGDLYLTVQPFHDTGVPLVGYFYYAIGSLPASVFLYKLLAFASTCTIGVLAYVLARRVRFLADLECVVIGATAIVWAAFRVYAVDVVVPYLFATAVLFVAFGIATRSGATWRGRVLAAMLVAIAELLYAPLFVFHYGLLAVTYLIDRDGPRGVGWLRARAELVVLPVIVFVAAKLMFPPTVAMTNNYSVKLDVGLFATHTRNFIANGIAWPIRESLNPIAFGAFVVVAAGVVFVGRKRRWWPAVLAAPVRSWREIAQLGGVALVLFGFGAGAFILIGKSPDGTFWWSRQAMLIPFAIGVAAIGITWVVRRAGKPIVMWLWLALAGWIAVGNWVTQQQTYVMLQARWISYRSLVHNIMESRAFEDVTFLHIDEQPFLDAGYQDHTAYTWSAMFAYFGWGADDKAVVARLPFEYYCDELETQPLETRRFALEQVNLAGQHAQLVLAHGPEAPYGTQNRYLVQIRLIGKYYVRRLFLRDDMAAFLRGVTKIERRSIVGPPPACTP